MLDVHSSLAPVNIKVGIAIILASTWAHLILSATENQLLGIIPFLMGAFPAVYPSLW